MGFLFGRKDRNETHGRREGVAKKAAAVLAAVAVAGGSAVVGMPQAQADYSDSTIFFRKMDESGELLGGSRWKLEYYDGFGTTSEDDPIALTRHVVYVEDGLTPDRFSELGLLDERGQRDKERQEAYIREHFGEYETPSRQFHDWDDPVRSDLFGGVDVVSEFVEVSLEPDYAKRDGEIAPSGFGPFQAARSLGVGPKATPVTISELSAPEGFASRDGSDTTGATFVDLRYAYGSGNPDPVADGGVRLFVCGGGLGLQVVRESVGVSHG